MIEKTCICETDLNFLSNSEIVQNIVISPLKTDTFDLAKKLYMCAVDGNNTVYSAQNYDCIFIYADHKLRYKTIAEPIKKHILSGVSSIFDIISGFDAEYGSVYYAMARNLSESVRKVYPEAITTLNINYSDFCILIPTGNTDLNALKVFTEQELKKISTNQIISNTDETDSYNDIKRTFEKKLYKTHVHRYNRHFDEYCHVLENLINTNCESNERKYRCMQIALQVLKTILAETHLRWIYDSGNIQDEDPETAYYYDINYEILSIRLDQFILQAADNTNTADQIWQLMNITDALLESIIECHKNKSDNVVHKNFYGFVPLIENNENSQEIDSLFSNHYSPYYCYGFLLVPPKNKYSFVSSLPAYIHEFFHYIPPGNRKKRNETVTLLTVYTVMHSLREKFFNENKSHREIDSNRSLYKEFVQTFSNKLMEMCYSISENPDISQYRDSMDYIANMRDLIRNIDFDKLYTEIAYLSTNNTNELALLINDINDCRNTWETYAADYLNTFTMVIREIRSDISMCKFLNLGLSDYISIMVNEPNFAKLPAISTADSTIIRFGFMTRYLYRCQTSCENGNFNKNWLEFCEAILTSVKENTDNNKILDRKNNLKEYLHEYIDITLEQKTNQYTDIDSLLFEDLIVGKKVPEYDPEYNDTEIGLIGVWCKDLEKYTGTKIAHCLRDIYRTYINFGSDTIECMRLEYACRLLFRDFLEW